MGFNITAILGLSVLDKPPWQQKIFSSMMAAMGRQLKQSVNVFQSFMLNLRLPEEKNKEKWHIKNKSDQFCHM